MLDDVPQGGEANGRPGLSIRIEHAERVNFAMQQHGVPLADRIAVTNGSDREVSGVRVRLDLENAAAEPWKATIDSIEPGATYGLEPTGFGVSAAALAQRTEAERTAIRCTVEVEEETVASASSSVELLAFDQWPGTAICPEVLAAFVTPNHPALVPLLRDASAAVGRATGAEGLDGYQAASRTRAAAIAEAAYASVAARGLNYINPPASFGRVGQRVRLADRLLRERMGACLDLSLLLAGLWEQAGLHPVILLFDDHAMAGFWTYEHHLAAPVLDDAATIRNRIALGDLVAVESTLLTHRNAVFGNAIERANERLRENDAGFHAVDIRSCRARSVRPLPLTVEAGKDTDAVIDLSSVATTNGSAVTAVGFAEAMQASELRDQPDQEAGSGGRIDQWSRRLLDLTLRNRLIHFRETKGTVQLAVPNVAAFEDELAGERRFELRHKEDGDDTYHSEEMRAGRVHTLSPPAEHAKRLLHIYRTARSAIEETGAGVLYLALGSLVWYESDAAEKPRRAPLLLLPAQLDRSSSGSGYRYRLSLTDDQIRPNITLLERLRVDLGINDPELESLPEDERGLDVAKILYRFRSAIREQPRWEVAEDVWLGLFSFSKFLMWRDLREQGEKLQRNALVRHLVSPGDEAFEPDPLPKPAGLDERLEPGEPLCTRDADSTQVAAVLAASAGRSFVLEGPPGTGKSQTIANMIADNLARGRRVLFVAEKMAALSVVRRRLDRDGLGPFCLELHSAKASKKEVLAQLAESLDALPRQEPESWEASRRQLADSREAVNSYVRELHQTRESGESLQSAIARLADLGEGPAYPPKTDDITGLSADRLAEMRQAVARLNEASSAVDPVVDHPLNGIGTVEWSFGLPGQAGGTIDRAISGLESIVGAAGIALESLGIERSEASALSWRELSALQHVAELTASHLLLCGAALHAMLDADHDSASLASMVELTSEGAGLAAKRTELDRSYEPEFWSIPHLEHLNRLRNAKRAVWPIGALSGWLARRKLAAYARQSMPPLDRVIEDLELARDVLQREAALSAASGWLGGITTVPSSTDVDGWDQLRRTASFAKELAVHLADLGTGEFSLAAAVREAAGDRGVAERLAEAAGPSSEAVRDRWPACMDELSRTLGVDPDRAFAEADAPSWIQSASDTLGRWRGALTSLNDWCAWRNARDAARAIGLVDLVAAFEGRAINRDELEPAFERGFAQRWIPAVADTSPAIRGFHPDSHDAAVLAFRQSDKAVLRAGGDVVYAKLAAGTPNRGGSVSSRSELGILMRELNKKARHMPTRRLIESLPTLLPRLKPCFLMSPLSVAQYLDASVPPFDLVVFDEASQIPVWDAVGAIARGTAVVVVGDSKQLPPTAFFDHLDDPDDEPDEQTPMDLESILKECNAAGVPSMRLGWHYRSRHESLIAFSNHHYYGDELQTFPSPVERGAESGVTLRFVEGAVYDRGGTRTNRSEAAAVVDEVVRMLTTPGETRSIGVVTFSRPQQQLVADLLDERRREQPEIDQFFDGGEEPVFIKNLENVQGDERDAIIFSVGYGPDENGSVSMNFGPLNADGGERRLNVAVTRARRSLRVFTSLRPEQIDLSRARATGVRHFKAFLEYADRGPNAMAEIGGGRSARHGATSLANVIASRLRQAGHDVVTGVGCGQYRVDIGVRHPDDPQRFTLGIECDGPTYRDASTARDRDRTRPAVMGGLGWRLERVWSIDWHLDPQRVMTRLEKAIRDATSGTPHDGQATSSRPVSTSDEGASEMDAAPVPPEPMTLPAYRHASCPDQRLRSRDLSDPRSRSIAEEAVYLIARLEGPITTELAQRRFAAWFGVRRRTAKFRELYERFVADATESNRIMNVDGVLWPVGADPDAYTIARTPGEAPESRRDLQDIPLVERSNAAMHTLRTQFGLPRDELAREAAALLGTARLTSNAAECMDEAIDLLLARGKITERGEMVVLADETA